MEKSTPVIVVDRDVSSPKLTIASTECRIKLPLGMNEDSKCKVLAIFDKVIDALPYNGATLRGSFYNGRVVMRNKTSIVKIFKF